MKCAFHIEDAQFMPLEVGLFKLEEVGKQFVEGQLVEVVVADVGQALAERGGNGILQVLDQRRLYFVDK